MNKRVLAAVLALMTAAALGGCGKSEDKSSSETESKTTTTAAVSETETVSSEAESAADSADTSEEKTSSKTDPADQHFVESTYEGDLEFKGVTIKTMGDAFGVISDDHDIGANGDQFICVLKDKDACYRLFANMPADIKDKFYEISIFDEDCTKQQMDLVKDLEVAAVQDLTKKIVAQKELDKFVGKTVDDLEKAGYEQSGWEFDGENGIFFYRKDMIAYNVEFNEKLPEDADFSEDGAMDGFTIKSMTYFDVDNSVFDYTELE